jgi:hypothetical protein
MKAKNGKIFPKKAHGGINSDTWQKVENIIFRRGEATGGEHRLPKRI